MCYTCLLYTSNAKLGTNYGLFNYYGAEDADRVIVAMGSICDVAEEAVSYTHLDVYKRQAHGLDVQCILTKKQGHATEIAQDRKSVV